MKILVVGNGGREHALLWKLARDAPDAELYVTRGNGGMRGLAASLPFSPAEIQPLAGWADAHGVDLTVVAHRPRLATHLDAMLASIAAILGLEPSAVSVKASTGNLDGSEGAGRSISTLALATIEARG